MLTMSGSIRELRLNDNTQIGDEAGLQIAQGLLNSGTIRVCHLSDTKISG